MVLGWDILDKQLLLLHRAWGEILGCGLSTCGSYSLVCVWKFLGGPCLWHVQVQAFQVFRQTGRIWSRVRGLVCL